MHVIAFDVEIMIDVEDKPKRIAQISVSVSLFEFGSNSFGLLDEDRMFVFKENFDIWHRWLEPANVANERGHLQLNYQTSS